MRGVARAQAVGEAASSEAPERRLLLRALRELAGFAHGVFYDVPRAEAPTPLRGSPIFLRGSGPWYRYLRARRQVDRGRPAAVLALRPLAPHERVLAIDWGSTFANCFYLIEPNDPGCDLTDPDNAVTRELEAAARALVAKWRPDERPQERWTAATDLGSALRRHFGV